MVTMPGHSADMPFPYFKMLRYAAPAAPYYKMIILSYRARLFTGVRVMRKTMMSTLMNARCARRDMRHAAEASAGALR